MKILSLYLCFLFLCLHTSFAQKIIVRGRVTDAKTGEALSDANVLEKNSSIGMATNAYGLYSITIQAGRCVLQCSMLGYTTWSDTLQLSDNAVVDIALHPNDYLLKGVEVVGARKHGGQFMLDAKEIQALPVVGGEADLMKTLQFLPGVQSGNEGANNISVRGSNQWGNLVLLDD